MYYVFTPVDLLGGKSIPPFPSERPHYVQLPYSTYKQYRIAQLRTLAELQSVAAVEALLGQVSQLASWLVNQFFVGRLVAV